MKRSFFGWKVVLLVVLLYFLNPLSVAIQKSVILLTFNYLNDDKLLVNFLSNRIQWKVFCGFDTDSKKGLTWSINSCLFRFVVFNAPPSECSNLSKMSISFHFESNTPVRGSTKAQWGSAVSLLWYILTKSTPRINNMRELDQNRFVRIMLCCSKSLYI